MLGTGTSRRRRLRAGAMMGAAEATSQIMGRGCGGRGWG